MSMLSAQVNELRELAEHLDERERGMDEYVTALRDAADTIWELRGSVHRERAEADRLRQESRDVGMAAYELGRKSMATEAAKLRELVRDYECCTMHADCSMCEYDGKLSTHCPLSPCFPDIDELYELGVKVG